MKINGVELSRIRHVVFTEKQIHWTKHPQGKWIGFKCEPIPGLNKVFQPKEHWGEVSHAEMCEMVHNAVNSGNYRFGVSGSYLNIRSLTPEEHEKVKRKVVAAENDRLQYFTLKRKLLTRKARRLYKVMNQLLGEIDAIAVDTVLNAEALVRNQDRGIGKTGESPFAWNNDHPNCRCSFISEDPGIPDKMWNGILSQAIAQACTVPPRYLFAEEPLEVQQGTVDLAKVIIQELKDRKPYDIDLKGVVVLQRNDGGPYGFILSNLRLDEIMMTFHTAKTTVGVRILDNTVVRAKDVTMEVMPYGGDLKWVRMKINGKWYP